MSIVSAVAAISRFVLIRSHSFESTHRLTRPRGDCGEPRFLCLLDGLRPEWEGFVPRFLA